MSENLTRSIILARVQKALRKISAEEGTDYSDRLMLAAVLAAGALAVAWPQQKAAPKWILRGAQAAEALWKRRSLWLDEAPASPDLHAVP